MSDRVTGWLFVAVQALLLAALVLLPAADHWPRPFWLRTAGAIAIIAGLGWVAAAALGLGRALTATPVPVAEGELRTSGLYRFVRHPIYSGVVAAVLGVAVRSGSLVIAAVAVATVAFFNVKARWEESRLASRYPGYAAYAAATPRLVPRFRPHAPATDGYETDRFRPDADQ